MGGKEERRKGMGRERKQRAPKRKRRVKTMFDTSSRTHRHTYANPHKGEGASVSIRTAAHSVTLYISKERDLNMQGPRRSP